MTGDQSATAGTDRQQALAAYRYTLPLLRREHRRWQHLIKRQTAPRVFVTGQCGRCGTWFVIREFVWWPATHSPFLYCSMTLLAIDVGLCGQSEVQPGEVAGVSGIDG
jgi:hypothetical protein